VNDISAPRPRQRGLFLKYLTVMMGMVCAVSLASGLIAIWFAYQDHKASLFHIQQEQAQTAATKIGQFVKEIEGHLGWMVQMPYAALNPNERRIDALRLLRQVPAITELAMLDPSGREQLRVSRLALDTVGSGIDRSNEPLFFETKEKMVFYGPVYLARESEPYMTIALAGARHDAGVTIAKVNLKFIWDVVSRIKVGEHGAAYVVNTEGRLIAHPDISLVLRNTDFSVLPQVHAARSGTESLSQEMARDAQGRPLLAAHAIIAPLGWLVLVERPAAEAFGPIYSSLLVTAIVLLGALMLAIVASFIMARKLVMPISILQAGAAQIGAGVLDHRIAIKTGDELEVLGDQFNYMAAQLQESYATLERRVEERTHQLELANLAKSRFLAAASHDLRQPLHAMNLFVAEFRATKNDAERRRIAERIDAAVTAMNRLFNALLDISKLDAGVLAPNLTEFPIEPLLRRVEATFTNAAREKRLRLRLVPSTAWVRSDAILLERILLNLVSNAVRYTRQGGIVMGCRRSGALLRLEVWDSGIGIPEDQQRNVFNEFYRIVESARSEGVGLGLAIVARLCALLDHPIALTSSVGKGSRFSVSVLTVVAGHDLNEATFLIDAITSPLAGKLVVVIDDDTLVLDGMSGLLRSWGCRVVAARSGGEAADRLAEHPASPDLIVSDFFLQSGQTGIEAIALLRAHFRCSIPAFLVSGDVSPDRLRDAEAKNYHLLHKPVEPMTLRAMLNQFLNDRNNAEVAVIHNGCSIANVSGPVL